MIYETSESTLFEYNGRHCEEFGVTFIPSAYPFIPRQFVPSLKISGRHGTIRYPGRTFETTQFKGTLYFLGGDETEPGKTDEMLRRASQVADWLCGEDGRGKLILDALPDRYYVAEADGEAILRDDADWMNGQAEIAFTCQPYARSIKARTQELTLTAGAFKSAALSVDGNQKTTLAFSVTNTATQRIDTMTIEAPDTAFEFRELGLLPSETFAAEYTDDDILLLRIYGVDGEIRSVMKSRTTQSDDDLILTPGGNTVRIKAQRACKAVLSARGRWL